MQQVVPPEMPGVPVPAGQPAQDLVQSRVHLGRGRPLPWPLWLLVLVAPPRAPVCQARLQQLLQLAIKLLRPSQGPLVRQVALQAGHTAVVVAGPEARVPTPATSTSVLSQSLFLALRVPVAVRAGRAVQVETARRRGQAPTGRTAQSELLVRLVGAAGVAELLAGAAAGLLLVARVALVVPVALGATALRFWLFSASRKEATSSLRTRRARSKSSSSIVSFM